MIWFADKIERVVREYDTIQQSHACRYSEPACPTCTWTRSNIKSEVANLGQIAPSEIQHFYRPKDGTCTTCSEDSFKTLEEDWTNQVYLSDEWMTENLEMKLGTAHAEQIKQEYDAACRKFRTAHEIGIVKGWSAPGGEDAQQFVAEKYDSGKKFSEWEEKTWLEEYTKKSAE